MPFCFWGENLHPLTKRTTQGIRDMDGSIYGSDHKHEPETQRITAAPEVCWYDASFRGQKRLFNSYTHTGCRLYRCFFFNVRTTITYTTLPLNIVTYCIEY